MTQETSPSRTSYRTLLAERDALRERAVAAEQERDRLRRELEALRADMEDVANSPREGGAQEGRAYQAEQVVDCIDAILRGEP
jgi:hypothetical protein